MLWRLVVCVLPACTLATPPPCDEVSETACFAGAMRGLLGERMADVEVCAPDYSDIACVLTDDEGTWRLEGFPRDTDVVVTATAENMIDTLFPQTTSMDWLDWYKVMVPESIVASNARTVGAELDPSMGHMFFVVFDDVSVDGTEPKRISNVTVTVEGELGTVFYANALGLAAAGRTETSSNGSGGVLNLPVGIHRVTFRHEGRVCNQQSFHFTPEGEAIPVPIRAGFTSAIDVMCPPEQAVE